MRPLHCCARKADSGSETPTAVGQHNIKIQEAAVRAQPGDASGSAVLLWALDGHRCAGWQMDRVVPRGETSETPDPILQRGLPDLVVISHQGGVCEEHLRLYSEHCPPFVHPCLNIESDKLPSPILDTAGSRCLLRGGGQPWARPRFRNAVLTDRPQKHKYQLAPASASLRKQGMTPLLLPCGPSLHHFSVEFFKNSNPYTNFF